MNLPASRSDPARRTPGSYHLLHPEVQRWVYRQEWSALRAIQARAIPLILDGRDDVIISATTATGKTEAAWLPIFSALAFDADQERSRPGVKALMISPLKALINDQKERLDTLGEAVDVPVHRRHGDVRESERNALRRQPDGVLLITPESLEAMFILQGPAVPRLLDGLRYIVIDELHAFMGSARGAQVQSLLHRIEMATGRRIPRIGLSATLADPDAARVTLRPDDPASVRVIHGDTEGERELLMQLRAYVDSDPGDDDALDTGADEAIARHLFTTLRGANHLVFANSRREVEMITDRLARLSDEARVPTGFFAHHGNLSREHREDVERRLKRNETPTTAICTSTLELGIDIGSVASIAQVGSPGVVSSVRQRLGRSGRKEGDPSILRMYVVEPELDARSHPEDTLRIELVEAVAVLDLLLEGWLEPVNDADLHISTLVQQILSVIAQHGGARAQALYRALCAGGPFRRVTPEMFADILRSLGQHDILMQASDGLLLPGEKGERLLNHYSVYSAFQTAEEYRLVADGRTLGTLPIATPVLPGTYLIFAGRRWEVLDIHSREKIIELRKAAGGRPPRFSGEGARVATGVRQRMRQVLESDGIPRYLDASAGELLAEGRHSYRHLGLHDTPFISSGNTVTVFPWQGDVVMTTLTVLLVQHGHSVERQAVSLGVRHASPAELQRSFRDIAMSPPDSALELARYVPDKVREKYDPYLSDDLLAQVVAARELDLPGALEWIRSVV